MDSFQTAILARELIRDRLREADVSRAAAGLPDRDRHRTPRQRVAWWRRLTATVPGAAA
jgi:hypothetical protein